MPGSSRSWRAALSVALGLLLTLSPLGVFAAPVADSDAEYDVCGRVFPDPHAYWPSPSQAPSRSPFAKGNAACASVDFLDYDEMVSGMTYLEQLFPTFVEFYNLEQDFGDGSDCATSTSPDDMCSAGLPRQGLPPGRVRSDLYMVRLTDERVPDKDKKFFTFPLSIHGIERAGAEAGVRIAEDLATWAYCEARAAGTIAANGRTKCAAEGAMPHALLETMPGQSISAGEAMRRSAVYLVFANPDGWKRGDLDNGARFFQRYNGNGVDMNRDWPTMGFSFRPYTPWSEPETRSFGKVLRQIRPKWDGGIDLHGQLIDRAFSFTLLGAGQQDYAKNQRILQTVKGAWADAESRLSWSPLIKPNTAPKDDQRLYGVQWGTVWDTIAYTTTGSFGDWINSPLGLDGDGIDNEMSLSHLSNCGVGSCYLVDPEQLHVDGNKSLVYSMVNFSLLPEDTQFRVPGSVAYVHSPKVLVNDGTPLEPPPGAGLPAQEPILDARLDTANGFRYEFVVKGFADGVANGGLEGKVTAQNVGGVGQLATTELILEKYRAGEEDPGPATACGDAGDAWEELNRYFDQADTYQQAGAAVHTNLPLPGRYRICLTGGLVTQLRAAGGSADLDITFSGEKAWEDPGQKPYRATNMAFFDDLAKAMKPGQLTKVTADDILAGRVNLDRFSSLVIADDAFPGDVEPIRTGPAQGATVFPGSEVAAKTAATVPCAYQPSIADVLPPTCAADFEFDVDGNFNNQQMTIALTAANAIDYDLYIERQSRISGQWSPVDSAATEAASETLTLLRPLPGHYRVRVVNWAAGGPADGLQVTFSNEYVGPQPGPSERTDAQRQAWGAALRSYVERGGNLVLTDAAVRDLALMGLVGRGFVNDFSVYAGYIAFTRDGASDSYDDPLAHNVDQPGAAEGPGFRHQTYEPVPIGYAITPADDDSDLNTAPVWSVDQVEWERLGGRTAGTTTADQVTLGEMPLGRGVVRVIGALLPMPTEQFYHPFGLANYALTYSGYQVLNNALQWQRPLPDLTVTNVEATSTKATRSATITATVGNLGSVPVSGAVVRFQVDGTAIGERTLGELAAGGTAQASIAWSLKGVANGAHVIEAVVDPADAIAETSEANNSGTRQVDVRGNKVKNGDFEASTDGTSPDAWTASGQTSYDGHTASADPGGTWTSAPIPVTAGMRLGFEAAISGTGTAVLQQLSATGAVLATAPPGALTTVLGTTQVRVVLAGGLAGTTTFDDIRLWEE
ncbi:MAG TPA: CARDB domain-containing protein [Candidatus Limnocylindrales bacterium]|nr:CARDB domain-containing protein [Candidatus Limnocylindrales bacterium]